MQTILDLSELEEVYIKCSIWSVVGPHCMKERIDGRSYEDGHHLNLPPPNSVKQLRTTIGNTSYYRKCIKGYMQITTPMEKLLKCDVKLEWT